MYFAIRIPSIFTANVMSKNDCSHSDANSGFYGNKFRMYSIEEYIFTNKSVLIVNNFYPPPILPIEDASYVQEHTYGRGEEIRVLAIFRKH